MFLLIINLLSKIIDQELISAFKIDNTLYAKHYLTFRSVEREIVYFSFLFPFTKQILRCMFWVTFSEENCSGLQGIIERSVNAISRWDLLLNRWLKSIWHEGDCSLRDTEIWFFSFLQWPLFLHAMQRSLLLFPYAWRRIWRPLV